MRPVCQEASEKVDIFDDKVNYKTLHINTDHSATISWAVRGQSMRVMVNGQWTCLMSGWSSGTLQLIEDGYLEQGEIWDRTLITWWQNSNMVYTVLQHTHPTPHCHYWFALYSILDVKDCICNEGLGTRVTYNTDMADRYLHRSTYIWLLMWRTKYKWVTKST